MLFDGATNFSQFMTELIAPQWIIPVEPTDVVHTDHAIVIEGGCIAALAPIEAARAQFPHATERPLPDHVVIPGLVNLHSHAAMTLMRGLADDTPLMPWLTNHIWPAEAKHLSDNFVYDGTALAAAEMIRSGTTCFADMYFYHLAAARAADAAGLRAAVGAAIIDFPTPYAADAEGYIARALDSRDFFADHPRLKLMLAPHAPYTVGDSTFRRINAIAGEAEFPVMLHVHETATEITDSEKAHGCRPITRLDKLGVLTPNLIAVHCVHLAPEEIQVFVNAGVHVAHCPTSNLKLASGFAPVAAMCDAGVNVGIGTDGAASNNRLDMFAEARLAALVQKALTNNAAALAAHQLLRMATLHGAKALGWDSDIGSLKVGKRADIVAVKLNDVETLPVFDPVSHLFYAAGREHVTHVWVDGKCLLDNGALTQMDIAELKAKARVWQSQLTAASSL